MYSYISMSIGKARIRFFLIVTCSQLDNCQLQMKRNTAPSDTGMSEYNTKVFRIYLVYPNYSHTNFYVQKCVSTSQSGHCIVCKAKMDVSVDFRGGAESDRILRTFSIFDLPFQWSHPVHVSEVQWNIANQALFVEQPLVSRECSLPGVSCHLDPLPRVRRSREGSRIGDWPIHSLLTLHQLFNRKITVRDEYLSN